MGPMPGGRRVGRESSMHNGDSHRSVNQLLDADFWMLLWVRGRKIRPATLNASESSDHPVHQVPKAVRTHEKLTALPGNQTFICQLSQVFGDSRPRGPHQIG
jgi:hypothetical protein